MTKDYLHHYGKLCDKIEKLRLAYESLDTIKAANLSPMPKGSSTGTETEKLIERREQIYTQLKDLESERREVLNNIYRALYTIEDQRTRMVMHMRYVRRLPWFQIADLMNGRTGTPEQKAIKKRRLMQLHNEGLEAIKNVD